MSELERETFRDLLVTLSPLQRHLLQILQEGKSERDILVETTETPRTTVYDNLSRLERLNLVKRHTEPTGNRGRPTVYFELRKLPEFMLEMIHQ